MNGKTILRTGVSAFLRALRDDARRQKLLWNIVVCGSRKAAFDAFRYNVDVQPDIFNVLLVDSEDAVTSAPLPHLRRHESWDFEHTSDNQVHLMVRTMETWIVADAEALAKYYGQGFHKNALPRTQDLETVDKLRIASTLAQATRRTQKGEYHKIRHAGDILALIDAEKVRRRCKHCERFFVILQAKIGGTS